MGAKSIRLLVPAVAALSLTVLSVTAYADGTTIRIPACVRAGGASAPAGSSITLVSGWTMSTRGNTEAFANAATGVMTVDGVGVTPVKSDVFQPVADLHPDGNADDAWRVEWSNATTAPAQAGQPMVVTFVIMLDRQVADHEGGSGQPGVLGPGPVAPLTCVVTAT